MVKYLFSISKCTYLTFDLAVTLIWNFRCGIHLGAVYYIPKNISRIDVEHLTQNAIKMYFWASYKLCPVDYFPSRPFETFLTTVHLESIRTCVTHKSTVARTVMCRQDGRGRFPVLLDDHSRCRTNSQRKSQLSKNSLYGMYIEWYIQTVQQITRTLIHKNQFTSLCRRQKPASKCIRLVYEILVICRALQALYTP